MRGRNNQLIVLRQKATQDKVLEDLLAVFFAHHLPNQLMALLKREMRKASSVFTSMYKMCDNIPCSRRTTLIKEGRTTTEACLQKTGACAG